DLLEREWNEFEFKHYRYAAHILNIAISYGMQLQTELIEKVRTFVSK
ncbi:25876_t:CDS:2, partial [Dentiscutata erythropus]